jgi:membrane protein implicated in regulation of membrane protease activity
MSISGDQAITAGAAPGPAAHREINREIKEKRYLFGPVTDFLCLGGVSFLLLPVMFMLPEKELTGTVAIIALYIAHFINHPHFAFSYQIFYEGFRHKAFGPDIDATLRARYIFAGIVVPMVLAAFLAYGMIFGDTRLLGYGANAMGFLVGWHYVKQGYGMLMVDAALKRQFFNDVEKKILLSNSYAVWALSWLLTNSALSERDLWGIQYYVFNVPPPVQAVGIAIAVATGIMTAGALIQKWRANGGSLPVSGVAAYMVSLYLWLLVVRWNVLWLLIVPALHSLQYLVVVARYRLNQERDQADAHEQPTPQLLGRVFHRRFQQRYAAFVGLGLVLGFIGFWGAPGYFQVTISYDQAVLGATAFLFVFWIFINVHHYFLDNVMWRSHNPDVRKYLFS